jgi:hypothetical protein
MRHADTLLTALTDTEVSSGMAALGSSKLTLLGDALPVYPHGFRLGFEVITSVSIRPATERDAPHGARR